MEEVQQLLDVLAKTATKLVEESGAKNPLSGAGIENSTEFADGGCPHSRYSYYRRNIGGACASKSRHWRFDGSSQGGSISTIVQQLVGPTEEIPVIVLDPGLEQILQQTLLSADDDGAGFEPGLAEQMQKALIETAKQREMIGESAILLVAAPIRQWIARFVKHSAPGMQVLSYNEIPDNRQIKVVATVGKSAGELSQGIG